MELAERIEQRRFVGREFLLWLWFESELFDETLHAAPRGEFGLALERELVLSTGKEATRISGQTPARAREAKEALLLGKLPERAGFRLFLDDREATFVLRADTLALASLALPTILTEGDAAAPGELGHEAPTRTRRRSSTVDEDAEREADGRAEVFYDRVDRAREVEGVLAALYRDFLALRLGPAWDALVVPALRRFARGEAVDDERYREARRAALEGRAAHGRAAKRRAARDRAPTAGKSTGTPRGRAASSSAGLRRGANTRATGRSRSGR